MRCGAEMGSPWCFEEDRMAFSLQRLAGLLGEALHPGGHWGQRAWREAFSGH